LQTLIAQVALTGREADHAQGVLLPGPQARRRAAPHVLTERFGTVISWRVIELIEQLLRADASGARADIEATTDATERVLRARRLL